MNPIIERELRGAAKKGSTYLGRTLIGLLAVLLAFSFLVAAEIMPSKAVGAIGANMFLTVSIYGFALCLLAGVLLTSDSLSEERREGTLPFLFLTDLKKRDIILGKFAARALPAFYSLLVVLPAMALPIFFVGETGTEFWRVTLTLMNTLFFSLTAGLCVSAGCQDWLQAMIRTTAIILVGGVLFLLPFLHLSAPVHLLCSAIAIFSPWQTFRFAFAAHYNVSPPEFWLSLMAVHLVSWYFLRLAAGQVAQLDRGELKLFGGLRRILAALNRSARRSAKKAELFDSDPLLWLVNGSAELRITVWVLAVVGGGAVLLSFFFGHFGIYLNHLVAVPTYYLFKVLFTLQACKFFSESRRNGALELLCCTPLEGSRFVTVQWEVLGELFWKPAVILMMAQALSGTLQMTFFDSGMNDNTIYSFFVMMNEIFKLPADLLALGWLGMWLGLSLKKPGLAGPLTIFFMLIAPAALFFVPDVVIDMIVIAWAKKKLSISLRTTVGQESKTRFDWKKIFVFYKPQEA